MVDNRSRSTFESSGGTNGGIQVRRVNNQFELMKSPCEQLMKPSSIHCQKSLDEREFPIPFIVRT